MLRTKLDHWCDAVIEAGWLAALIVAPLFFNVFSSRVFEPDKISLVRSVAIIMLLAWLIKLLNGGQPWLPRAGEQAAPAAAIGPEAGGADNGLVPAAAWWQRLLQIPFLLPVILLVLSYAISTLLSVAPRVSWWGSYQRLQGTYTYLSYIIIALLTAAHLRTPDQIRRLQHAIIVTSLPIAIYGVIQKMDLDPLPWGGDVVQRVAGNAGNAIFLAAYLIMALFLTLERVYSSFAYLLKAEPDRPGYDSSRDMPSALAGGAYLFVLFVQVLAIVFTQSRGPWIGLMVGLYLFVLLMLTGLRPHRYRTLTGIWVALGTLGVVFVLLINSVFASSLASVPYLGRMTQLLEQSGTGQVRLLIWEGTASMVAPHPPLIYPDGNPDRVNPIRPLVGYGPEAMWVAFNSFYPPQLAQLESRNASPDRSHNETWDSLAITGFLGFVAYVLLFLSIFYQALRWLGLITSRQDTWLFLGLWLGMGAAMSVVFYLYDGSMRFFGVALPVGFLAGLVTYITLAVFMHQKAAIQGMEIPRQLLIIAILATIVAHFAEIHFGIAIAATRTYFWVLSAMLFTLGTGLSAPAAFVTTGSAAGGDGDDEPEVAARSGGKIRRRKRQPSSEPPRRATPGLSLPSTILTDLLIFCTLVFIYLSNSQGSTSVPQVLFGSITSRLEGGREIPSLALLLLLLFTWLVAATLSLSLEVLRRQRAPAWGWWLRGYLLHALVVGGGWLLYGLVQASRLLPRPAGTPLADQLDHVAGHFTLFTWLLIAWILAAATLYSWGWLRDRRTALGRQLAFSLGVGAVATLLIFVFISRVNVALVRADVFYKQGQQFDSSGDWVGSVELYRQALTVRPTEDHYLLFLGRALLERSRQAPAEGSYRLATEPSLRAVLELAPEQVAVIGQQDLLSAAEVVLLEAQRLNPLNTDHTANLARLYRNWADLAQDPDQRQTMLDRSVRHYVEAVRLSPNAAHLHNEKGIIHMTRGEYDQALAAYERSLSLDNRYDQTYLLLSEYYERQGETEQLIETLQVASQQLPRSVQIRSYLGVALARTGDLTGALEANLSAITLSPHDLVTLRNLTLIYRDLGEIDKAIEYGLKALERVGGDVNGEIQLRQLLAELYLRQGDSTATLGQYEQMRLHVPDNVAVLNTLADLYIQEAQPNQAVEVLQTLASLQPTDYQYPLRLAQLLRQVGQIDPARQFGQRALELAPAEQRPAIEQFVAGLNP